MSGLIDPKLAGSVLMFGFRGGTLNDPETSTDIAELKRLHPRGVILFDHDIAGNHPRNIHNPKQLNKLIGDLRHELGEELVIGIDQEGGAVARLREDNGFLPTVSAEDFASMLEMDQIQYSDRQARQLRELGIDLNFAPCVDLSIDPSSPIIAGRGRSFGVDVQEAARCAGVVIAAHERHGVRCCIKHFPGHGSALLDSHMGLTDITRVHQPEELQIFQALVEQYNTRVAVMSGHLVNTTIDPDLPASLSPAHTTGVLRDRLGFDGVVVTDSLDMRAIRDRLGEGQASVLAIEAGADLILDGLNAPGYREPGGATRITQGLRQHGNEEEIIAASRRLDRFFSPIQSA
tara:strand:- start:59866 stop:60906 length:1041 start_codon:yes stop_codon:yes gene_type:complete